MTRLPPLNSLRAFEVAARQLSFTKAAEELHVTPAAVSHQVKALEEHLSVRLFRRLNHMLLLTDAGKALLPGLSDGFGRLTAAAETVREHSKTGMLTISVDPSFASKWLVPRLHRFHDMHPDTDVRICASTRLVDFAREEVDVGVRYGSGHYPGLRADCLATEEVFPVCSPTLLTDLHPLRMPDDLRWRTLLHEDWAGPDSWPTWRTWLRAAGARNVDPDRGARFSFASLAIQAAIEGYGVALGSSVLVTADLATGHLVKPFAVSVPAEFGYFFVCPETTARRRKVAAFREWIVGEASRPNPPTAPL